MKKLITVGSGIGALLIAGTATAGYQGMSAEHVGSTSDGEVYRFYVNLDSGSRLDAVYGSAENNMWIGYNGDLFNHAFGGNSTLDINPALVVAFPSLVNDSWVTIGLADQTGNAMSIQSVDFGADGNFASSSNGSWYVTPDDAQGAEVGGQVLIAQLTIADGGSADGFFGNLNFQGKNADGSTWGATNQWIPAPGALALLGLAGIAGRRRRRA